MTTVTTVTMVSGNGSGQTCTAVPRTESRPQQQPRNRHKPMAGDEVGPSSSPTPVVRSRVEVSGPDPSSTSQKKKPRAPSGPSTARHFFSCARVPKRCGRACRFQEMFFFFFFFGGDHRCICETARSRRRWRRWCGRSTPLRAAKREPSCSRCRSSLHHSLIIS